MIENFVEYFSNDRICSSWRVQLVHNNPVLAAELSSDQQLNLVLSPSLTSV